MLVKVYQRQLDDQGKIVFKTVRGTDGVNHQIAEAKEFYMDLSETQEHELLGMSKKYALERVFNPDDITQEQKDKGAELKATIFPPGHN